jgi:hypothetical protein
MEMIGQLQAPTNSPRQLLERKLYGDLQPVCTMWGIAWYLSPVNTDQLHKT